MKAKSPCLRRRRGTAPSIDDDATIPTPEVPADDLIYLTIVWYQHQPVYFKDPETGVYTEPWVRVHATNYYYDMAAILKNYPNTRATCNPTPSLLRQLDDIAAGANDEYWEMTMVPAEELTEEQKCFILRRFFDINPRIIGRFPRYSELQAMRAGFGDAEIEAARTS